MKWLVVACAGAALTVTGCGSTASETPDRVGSVAPTTLLVASSSAAARPLDTSNTTAQSIAKGIPEVSKVVELDEDTDANQLLGRPNGYEAATVLIDSRATCDSEGPGVDCGAVIEQFPNETAAQRRSEYIQRIRGTAQELGQEYNTISGVLLLRISGDLKPSAAKQYEEAFNRATT